MYRSTYGCNGVDENTSRRNIAKPVESSVLATGRRGQLLRLGSLRASCYGKGGSYGERVVAARAAADDRARPRRRR